MFGKRSNNEARLPFGLAQAALSEVCCDEGLPKIICEAKDFWEEEAHSFQGKKGSQSIFAKGRIALKETGLPKMFCEAKDFWEEEAHSFQGKKARRDFLPKGELR